MDPVTLSSSVEREQMRTANATLDLHNALRIALAKLIRKATRASERGKGFHAWAVLPYSVRDMLWTFEEREAATAFAYTVLTDEMQVNAPVWLYLLAPSNDYLSGIPRRAQLSISLIT